MPYTAIIPTIISNSKSVQICDSLHDVQVATSEDEFIVAGLPEAITAYRNGVLTDTMISSLTEATLNNYFVYTTGTYTITNPSDQVFIFKEANVTVNVDGNNKCKINVLGGSTLNLVASGNAYVTVRAFGQATINITVGDNAIVDFLCEDDTTATVTLNSNGIINISGNSRSAIVITENDSSYCFATMNENSQLTYYLNGSATIDFRQKDSSIVINGALS